MLCMEMANKKAKASEMRSSDAFAFDVTYYTSVFRICQY